MITPTKFIRFASILLFAGIVPIACTSRNPNATQRKIKEVVTFTFQSPAFTNNQPLPSRFACGGAGVSPPLTFSHLPDKTKTLAFVLEDPDAPKGTFTHWLIWNWPAAKTNVQDALPAQDKLSNGAVQGTGSNGKIGYNPPCPPSGTHHYYLKAYALDSTLTIPSSSDKQALLAAMQGHVLGQGMLMGTYHKG